MKNIKGPAIFLAQFAGDATPFNTLDGLAGWAAGLGYKGIQMPSWDGRLFDLEKAAKSKGYCEEVAGTLAQHGLQITELSTHLQGQLVAVHPAYDAGFDGFAAPEVRGDPVKRQQWAVQQMLYAAKASANLGLTAHASFSCSTPSHTLRKGALRVSCCPVSGASLFSTSWPPIQRCPSSASRPRCWPILRRIIRAASA